MVDEARAAPVAQHLGARPVEIQIAAARPPPAQFFLPDLRAGPARSACRRSVTCVAAPKYTDPSMRSSFSWGHSGNSPGCPSSTAKWRCGSAASKPIGRMAGRAVRYR
ncbi:Uncharacterised protein [Bordetella pertussis]|nr:Uncharacterised protein [Bordetella pertussis]